MPGARTLRVQPVAVTVARRLATLTLRICAAAILLSACDPPTGTPPSWRGTYLDKAVTTNPNGGGPQVIRYGPPGMWGGNCPG